MNKREEIISESLLFRGRKFTVRNLKVRVPSGDVVDWEVVDKGGDSVAIVAIDANRNIHLIEEYFGAIDERMLSLPKGMIELGETPAEAALRELREEIGYAADLKQIAVMEVSPSYLRQKTFLFLATGLLRSPLVGDEREFIEERVFPLSIAENMIVEGKITEARTIAGILMAAHIYGFSGSG